MGNPIRTVSNQVTRTAGRLPPPNQSLPQSTFSLGSDSLNLSVQSPAELTLTAELSPG